MTGSAFQAQLVRGLVLHLTLDRSLLDDPNGFGATAPDLPGCFAVGASREDVERLIQEAITEHVALLRAQGHPVPEPLSSATEVEIEQLK